MLTKRMQGKLTMITERYKELGGLLIDPAVIQDHEKYKKLGKEYAQIEPIVQVFEQYQLAESELQEAESLRDDPEFSDMADGEIELLKNKLAELFEALQTLLLPRDPDDACNVFLEIRAGTGGDEAAIFSGDLFRMYAKYAESHGWRVEVMNLQESDQGGFKEVIVKIIGEDAYARLKFESGAHRVQRVPETESQGRVHTSACTVAVLPELTELENIEINASDLRIDTYRASGAGGQHVNKTDSAVRLTHLPTGIVVECQDERSQHKNKAQAMSLLKNKILSGQREKQRQEQAQQRKSLVGSGDRSERIRTYNFPQGRVTDHRINLTLYQLEYAMNGDLDAVIDPLIQQHQADLLASVGD